MHSHRGLARTRPPGSASHGLLDIDSLVARRYPLADINRAYEEMETDAVGRGVIVS